jgi:hypothetical protein
MAGEQSKPKGPDLGRGIPFGDVPDGSMLAGHVGDDAVLLVRRGKEFFAVFIAVMTVEILGPRSQAGGAIPSTKAVDYREPNSRSGVWLEEL